jgi:hypothetical protein
VLACYRDRISRADALTQVKPSGIGPQPDNVRVVAGLDYPERWAGRLRLAGPLQPLVTPKPWSRQALVTAATESRIPGTSRDS